jgi:hypothetical protein
VGRGVGHEFGGDLDRVIADRGVVEQKRTNSRARRACAALPGNTRRQRITLADTGMQGARVAGTASGLL